MARQGGGRQFESEPPLAVDEALKRRSILRNDEILEAVRASQASRSTCREQADPEIVLDSS
jgi:hypothetical protein